MADDPGEVVSLAYAALAAGEFDTLIRFIDEASLSRIRDVRASLARDLASRAESPGLEHLRDLLDRWGVGSVEELEMLDPTEAARRGLDRLPAAIRSTMRCVVGECSMETPTTAVVRYRVGWRGAPIHRGPVREARLRRGNAGWRLQPLLLSPWLVPGLENILFAESLEDG